MADYAIVIGNLIKFLFPLSSVDKNKWYDTNEIEFHHQVARYENAWELQGISIFYFQ